MKHLQIMIKPASGLCNMRCKYCFYYDVMENRDIHHFGMMNQETTKEIIKKSIIENPSMITYIFQGGEPTLAGYEYFEYFIETVREFNVDNVNIEYSIQTNGTLLTEEMVKLFKENNFLVGISIDGPVNVHNLNRLNHKKVGTYDEVIKGLELLQKYEVDYNILTVITNHSANNVKDIYNHLTNQGTSFIQFIPCIDDFGENKNELSSDNFAKFYSEIFDLWYKDYKNGKIVNIQYFDNILRMILNLSPLSCTLFGRCIVHKVVESNGDVYPCDFYMTDEWKLGNIKNHTFTDLVNSELASKFVQSSLEKHNDCKKCRYFGLCRGGCRRNKEPFTDVQFSKTKFCDGIIKFFDHTINRFEEIANDIIKK